MIKLYTKQDIAQLMNLSYKTLRVYEEKGLIEPVYINPQNGYKYYDENQLYTINMIRYSNSELDISLAEIKEVLNTPDHHSVLIKLLQQKKEKAESMIAKYQRIIENLEHSLEFNSVSKELYVPYIETIQQTYSYIELDKSIGFFKSWNAAQMIYDYIGHKRFNFFLQVDADNLENVKRTGVLYELSPSNVSSHFLQEDWDFTFLSTRFIGYYNFQIAIEQLKEYASANGLSLDLSSCYLEYHSLDISTLTHADTVVILRIKIEN